MNKAIRAAIEDIPGAFILVSAYRREDHPDFLEATMSFIFQSGDYAAEWEPEFGPITVWHRCGEDSLNAQPHYFFSFIDSAAGNWSHIAVEENGLKEAFLNRDYKHIFEVLEHWAL